MQTALSLSALTNNSSSVSSDSDRISDSRVTNGDSKRTPNMRLRFDQAHTIETRNPCVVEQAIQGNHLAIQSFLQRLLHRPSSAEFNSATLRNNYQSSERLIVKSLSDRSIVGHVQLEPQTIRFGRSEIPISRFRDLALLPEYRRRGYDDRLLASAEKEAKRSGAMLMVTQGEDYKLLRKNGWALLGSDPVSMVSPQRLLGQLPAPAQPESPFYASQMPTWSVRIGRLTDLDALSTLYETKYGKSYGNVLRSKEKWSWLISKRAHDRIYLFIENDQPLAYVVVRGASVMSLSI